MDADLKMREAFERFLKNYEGVIVSGEPNTGLRLDVELLGVDEIAFAAFKAGFEALCLVCEQLASAWNQRADQLEGIGSFRDDREYLGQAKAFRCAARELMEELEKL